MGIAGVGVLVRWDPAVHAALDASFVDWIHEADLFRRLADCPVPVPVPVMTAGCDIRPSWPLRQLAALVPNAAFAEVPGVPHDSWATHPEVWVQVITTARRVPILPPERIRTLPFGTGLVLFRSAPPIITTLRRWTDD
jgi:pimeloyl-ACP methyl ester carboxylesterase